MRYWLNSTSMCVCVHSLYVTLMSFFVVISCCFLLRFHPQKCGVNENLKPIPSPPPSSFCRFLPHRRKTQRNAKPRQNRNRNQNSTSSIAPHWTRSNKSCYPTPLHAPHPAWEQEGPCPMLPVPRCTRPRMPGRSLVRPDPSILILTWVVRDVCPSFVAEFGAGYHWDWIVMSNRCGRIKWERI